MTSYKTRSFWIGVSLAAALAAVSLANGALAQEAKPPLYYQDPDGKPIYSATPKTTSDGRAFKPIYKDKAGRTSASAPAAGSASPSNGGKGRILYYRNPMGLPDTSPVPKKDSMGMDYIPVYENEADTSVVQVSPGKLQMLGVRTAPVEVRQSLTRTIRATGTVQLDERRIVTVTTRIGGWAERIRIAVGEPVKHGDALIDLYSPELTAAEGEYVAAAEAGEADLAAAALQRLHALGAPKTEIGRLTKSHKAARLIPIASPIDGIVAEQQVTQGARVEPQMPLYKIADLSALWLIAEVQERDIGSIAAGQRAHASVVAFPGRRFDGKVDFIYPALSGATRTAKVRIAFPNPDLALRAEMYATVEIEALGEAAVAQALVVPDSAIIDSGTQQVALVDLGEGRFEPRLVRLGARGDGYTEVLEGLAKTDRVVIGANFLIDSESNLRAALQGIAVSTPTAGASQ